MEQQSGVTGMEFQANVSSGGNFRGYYVQLINKTTIRIIIITINVDDIFYYYSNDLQFQEDINKMIAQAV